MDLSIFNIVPIILIIALMPALGYGLKKRSITISAIALTSVAIILIGSVLIPIISDTDGEVPSTIHYDDYFLVDAVSAYGSMELVEVDGVTYAHAVDIGPGVLIYSDHNVNVNVIKAELDIFLLAGQSNIAYISEYADISKVDPIPKMGMAYYFGTTESPFSSAISLEDCTIQSMLDSNGDLKIGRFEAPFSAEYSALSGHKVLTINVAIGGKSIDSYQPGAEMYERSKIAWNAALNLIDRNYYNIHPCGMVWSQGEADTYKTVDQYKTAFLTMWDSIRSIDFSNEHLKKCYINLIKPIRGMNSREAQIELANEKTSIFIASTVSKDFSVSNGKMIDETSTLGYIIHYSQLGENECGISVAKYIAKV